MSNPATSATNSATTIGNPMRPMMKSVFDLMDFEDVDDGYVIGTYNGVSIMMTADMESFRISDIIRTLSMKKGAKRPSKDPYSWKRSEDGIEYQKDPVYGPLLTTIAKPKAVAGLYAPLCHFYMFLFYSAGLKAQKWLDGLEWEGKGEEGYLYLVQPTKCIGTDTYKFGESGTIDQRYQKYGPLMVEYRKAKVTHRHTAEDILMTHARMHFEQSPEGKEFFIIPNIDDGIRVFGEALIEIRNKGL